MSKGQPPTSPWMFYDSGGDSADRHITGTVTFSGTLSGSDPSAWTATLTGGTVTRDAGCVWTRLIVGPLNPDGTPGTGSKVIDMTGITGARSFSQAQMNAVGLVRVNDISGLQITAST